MRGNRYLSEKDRNNNKQRIVRKERKNKQKQAKGRGRGVQWRM